MAFSEKRIYLIEINPNLTARNAQITFELRLPAYSELVESNGGIIEKCNIKKSTYLLCLCDEQSLVELKDALLFIVSCKDVTDKIVNDGDYEVDNSVLQHFDYVRFELAYRDDYEQNATVDYAKFKIEKAGSKSRYIDHKVVYNHERNNPTKQH